MSAKTWTPDDPLLGTLFGSRYRVLSLLGEGGMGTVYRCLDTRTGQPVALKVVHPDHRTCTVAMRRFLREMHTASRVTHPNTVQVLDSGQTEDGTPYLAMEVLDGVSLKDRIADRGSLPLAEALHVARQVCRALQAMHDERIVHRDLKPDNIMLCTVDGRHDQVRVLDFGIARFADSCLDGLSERITATGVVIGTPTFISPERLAGEPLDERSDLYCLGVLLFEMLTGHPPFEDSDHPMRVLQMHMTQAPPTPSSRAPECPTWLDEVILGLLSKYPEDRPDSAADVLAALDRPRPPPERPPVYLPLWSVLGAAVVAGGLAGLGLAMGAWILSTVAHMQ